MSVETNKASSSPSVSPISNSEESSRETSSVEK